MSINHTDNFISIVKNVTPASGNSFFRVKAISEPEIKGVVYPGLTNNLNFYSNIDYIAYSTDLLVNDSIVQELNDGYKALTDFFKIKFHFTQNMVSPIAYIKKTSNGNQVFMKCKYNFQPEDMVFFNSDNDNSKKSFAGTINFKAVPKKGDILFEVRAEPNFTLVDKI